MTSVDWVTVLRVLGYCHSDHFVHKIVKVADEKKINFMLITSFIKIHLEPSRQKNKMLRSILVRSAFSKPIMEVKLWNTHIHTYMHTLLVRILEEFT